MIDFAEFFGIPGEKYFSILKRSSLFQNPITELRLFVVVKCMQYVIGLLADFQ